VQTKTTRGWALLVLVGCLLLTGSAWPDAISAETAASQMASEHQLFLPAVLKPEVFDPIPGASYSTLCMSCVSGWVPTDREPSQHADLNLALRGWAETTAYRGLVDISGAYDEKAPQFYGLYADERVPPISRVYRVYDWNWTLNQRAGLLSTWPVTLLGAATIKGEIIQLPPRSDRLRPQDVDEVWLGSEGYVALVLYATSSSITLKFTREDNVVHGYTIHLDGLQVDPRLVSLYQSCHAGGRRSLPALRERQPFARAGGSELRIAIRDNGSFMDPRSRKDWWYGH